MSSIYKPVLTSMILIELQSCQCFLRKKAYGVLIACFRAAFLRGDISMGGTEAKSGEMMEALMGP